MLEASAGPGSSSETSLGGGGDEALVCRACEQRITAPDLRVERAGAHEHTFVNPGGFVHHVGCFAAASGLAYRGEPETAFSWFPGWSWQIAECSRCGTHLGWVFRCAGEQFHGLLVGKLVGKRS